MEIDNVNSMIRAIYQQKNMLQVDKSHTWKVFDALCKEKDIYLFGAGVQGLYFVERYRKKYSIKGIFDNSYSTNKYGIYGIEVRNPEEILKLDKTNTVIIITSTNYYEAILRQLEKYEFHNYYILCKMEMQKFSNKIKVFAYSVVPSFFDKWNLYASKHFHKNYRERIEKGYREVPIQRNKILFFSYGKYNDHAKYISEYAYQHAYEWDLVWVLDENVECPDYVRRISSTNRQTILYELTTAKIWITTAELPPYAVKRKGQYCIQTKHWSSITLKKFYYDTPIYYRNNRIKRKDLKHNTSLYDYVVVGSQFDERTCRSGYRYHGKFLHAGSPRTDVLINQEIDREEICAVLEIDSKKKFLLYAPTFRVQSCGEEITEKVSDAMPDFTKLKKCMKNKFGGEWEILLRLHPHIAKDYMGIYTNETSGLMDVSMYSDIQELLAIADCVITDYSSLMFEPAMVGKMVMLYAPDYQEFVKNERELWFKLEDLPFPLSYSDNQLFDIVKKFSEERYQNDVACFMNKYGICEDGHACERVVKAIEKLMA